MSGSSRQTVGIGDHYPTCPRCGSLCGVLAEVCADCGERLYPSAGELEAARRQAAEPPIAALMREAEQATRERGE
jgi:hypothetical protein